MYQTYFDKTATQVPVSKYWSKNGPLCSPQCSLKDYQQNA